VVLFFTLLHPTSKTIIPVAMMQKPNFQMRFQNEFYFEGKNIFEAYLNVYLFVIVKIYHWR